MSIEHPYFAFKTQYHQPVNVIKTPGLIINSDNSKKYKSNSFVWDTGATASCLNTHIIEKLNLPKVSIKSVRTASGENECFCYHVDVILPHNVGFKNLLVTGLPLAEGIDALIGMDIIGSGSFLFSTDSQIKKPFFQFSNPPLPYLDDFILKAHKRNERNYKKLKRANPHHPLLKLYKFPSKK